MKVFRQIGLLPLKFSALPRTFLFLSLAFVFDAALVHASATESKRAAEIEEKTETPERNSPSAADLAPSPPRTNFFYDIPGELISPWTTDARPWLLGGIGLTIIAAALRDSVTERWQRYIARESPLNEWTKYADKGGKLYPQFAYVGGMLGHWIFWGSKNSLRRAEVMVKASAYSGLFTAGLKESIHQPRPNTGLDKQSFPSGHATVAFAFSAVVTAEHGFFPFGLLATMGAAFVGFSRMNDNKHYLHDVIGGATVGTAYGLGVSYFSQSRRAAAREGKEEEQRSTVELTPIYTDDIKGLVATWTF